MTEVDRKFIEMAADESFKSTCLSRRLGAIIVNNGNIVSGGHNAPPGRIGTCTDSIGLERFLNVAIAHGYIKPPSGGIKSKYELNINATPPEKLNLRGDINDVISRWGKICPRKILGFESGEGLELCPAIHAEAMAIVNAAKRGIPIDGATLYSYSPLPCRSCASLIIQSGIKKVFAWDSIYDPLSVEMFNESNIEIISYDPFKY